MHRHLIKNKPKQLYKPFGLNKSGTTALRERPSFRPSESGKPESIASREASLPANGFSALQTDRNFEEPAERAAVPPSIPNHESGVPANLPGVSKLRTSILGGRPLQLKYTPKKPNLQVKKRGEKWLN